MSSVQIRIVNFNVNQVIVSTMSESTVVLPGQELTYEIPQGRALQATCTLDNDELTIRLSPPGFSEGIATPVVMSSLDLADLTGVVPVPLLVEEHNSPIVRTTTSMLWITSVSYTPGVEPEGVKCGEIIIYPPA